MRGRLVLGAHHHDAFNAGIGGWDVSKVTNMNDMFHEAAAFDGDIGAWDTSAVTSMEDVFRGATVRATTQSRLWGTF